MTSPHEGPRHDAAVFSWQRLARAHVPILGSIVLMSLLEALHVLAPLERMEFDLLINTQPPHISDVTAVIIDGEDYAQHFEGRSPLKADMLRQLIEAVLKGKPSVVGVDIDTSHPSFAGAMDGIATTAPIVWAEGRKPCEAVVAKPVGAASPLRIEPGDPACVVPRGVLGMAVAPPSLLHGISAFAPDGDGVIRKFRPTLPTPFGDMPTFSTMLWTQHSRNSISAVAAPTTERYFNFSGPSLAVPAVSMRYVLQHQNDRDWAQTAPFATKIAVIGGTYDEGDVAVTSIGPTYGVQLVAEAAGASLGREPIAPGSVWSIIAEYVCGIIAFVVLSVLPRRAWSWLLIFLAIPTLACLSSIVFFATYRYWLRFATVIVGLYTEQLWHNRA